MTYNILVVSVTNSQINSQSIFTNIYKETLGFRHNYIDVAKLEKDFWQRASPAARWKKIYR